MAEIPHSPTLPLRAAESSPALSARQRFTEKVSTCIRSLIAGTLLALPQTAHTEDMISMPSVAEPVAATAASVQTSTRAALGSLVIAGGGELPDTVRDRFVELAGGKEACIVIIPTASEKASLPDQRLNWYWKDIGSPASVELLHTVDSGKANDPDFVEPLRKATGVWFSGGAQDRLVEAYLGTLVEKELKKVFERGGVIGGTSAGASAMSLRMITGGNPVATIGTGFGFLPGAVVDQHFDERNRLSRLLGAVASYPDCLGVGIDERTAIIVQSTTRGKFATVLGERNVRVCYPPHCKREVEIFKDGDEIDVSALHLVVAGAAKR